jgi:hypothetical protein
MFVNEKQKLESTFCVHRSLFGSGNLVNNSKVDSFLGKVNK